ncbi:MAG: hypothetical protein ACREJ9_03525 [Candidatus Rokuibacteriota bacterium]
MNARRLVVSASVAALSMAVGACVIRGAGRSFGRSAAASGLAYVRSDSGRAQLRELSDSTLHQATVSFRMQVQPTLDSAVHEILARGDSAVERAERGLANAVEGRLSEALTRLVRTNLRVTGEEGRAQLDLTIQRLAVDLERDLVPVLRRSVTASTADLMAQLSASVRTELKVAAESALAAAVRAGVEAGAGAARRTPLWKTVLWIGGGIIAALVFLAVAWLIREHRRSVAALDVVTSAIQQEGSSGLKERIHDRAAQRQVEGWLQRYMAKRGYA